MNEVRHESALTLLESLPRESTQLVWTDPPFGTNKRHAIESDKASRGYEYQDKDVPWVADTFRQIADILSTKLTDTGVLAVCIDHRAVHQLAVAVTDAGLLPKGEVIWHSELGGTAKKWWTNKHNTVLLFSKTDHPLFHWDALPEVPRRAPTGNYQSNTRKVNSVISKTLASADKERVGYPTQKPLDLVEPFVLVHTNENDLVVDPFCGSGTTAVAAKKNNRRYLVGDESLDAVDVARTRLNAL